MSSTKSLMILAIVSLFLMSFTAHTAQKWDFLGQRKVDFGVDRDEIKVTIKEGTFQKLKLQVKKAPVEFNKVIVHYRNGSSETIAMKDHVRAGGESRVIDLKGNNRFISSVVFYYNSKLRAKKKGTVRLFGYH